MKKMHSVFNSTDCENWNKFLYKQRSDDLAVSNLAVNVNESVQATNGNIEKLMPNYKDFMFNIKRDLIDTITQKPTTSAQTQTTRGYYSKIYFVYINQLYLSIWIIILIQIKKKPELP